jgi:hypothetical protein
VPSEPQGVLIAMTPLQRNIQQPTSLSIDRGLAPDLLLTCKGGQAWVKSVVAEHSPSRPCSLRTHYLELEQVVSSGGRRVSGG